MDPAYGRLKDPGLSEAEIRQGWQDFSKISSDVKVRGAYPYMSCFEKAARKYHLPLPLLLAMARGESNFDPNAKSNKACYGIMQILWPDTAKFINQIELPGIQKEVLIRRKKDLFDPCTNIRAGAKFLAWLLNRYNGNMYLAVAAYNYGQNAVSDSRVPKGAQWYAAYIHDHLQAVSERHVPDKSQMYTAYIHRHLQHVASNKYEKTGRLLVLEFTFYKTADKNRRFFEEKVKGVSFDIFRSNHYTYDLYIMYKSSQELRAILKRLKEQTGITPKGAKK